MVADKDYRNTEKCQVLSDIQEKKDKLEVKIRKEHKMARIMYNYINEKQGVYFQEFADIYNHKCAYCGASHHFIDVRLFEVDHYINESSFQKSTEGRAEAGKVSNLIFACYSCNRGKSSFLIKDGYTTLLNPDDNSIAKVFSRDDEYYIKVNNCFLDDNTVQIFYQELMLGSEARRLDFLLIEMHNLVIHLQERNLELSGKLEQCIARLMMKKNYNN